MGGSTLAAGLAAFGIVACALPERARAQSLSDVPASWSPPFAFDAFPVVAAASLVRSYGGGGGAIARAPHGVFMGADAGAAIFPRWGKTPTKGAPAFGLRAGYQWRNGLSLELRFDDLGVQPPDRGGSLLVPSGGVRYSLPFIVEPFAEALAGGVFNGSHASPGGGLGLGASFPVVRHFAFDLAVRNWLTAIDGEVRDIPTFEVGIAVGFWGNR